MLTVFISIGLVITTMAVSQAITSLTGSSLIDRSMSVLRSAESGANEALLRIVRDPNYTGETLTVADSTVTITVAGSSTKTITIASTDGTFRHQLQLITQEVNGIMTLQSWTQIY